MQQIFHDAERSLFLLQTGNASYAFAISDFGLPIHLYFGAPLNSFDDLPSINDIRPPRVWTGFKNLTFQEYPAFFGGLSKDNPLQITYASGARGSRLEYQNCQITSSASAQTLEVTLADRFHGMEVILYYTVWSDSFLLERRATIRNTGEAPFVLHNAPTANLPFFSGDFPCRVTHYAGRWGAEGQRRRTLLTSGTLRIENRNGLSGPNAVPLAALDDGTATEECGNVVFGTLHWSGSWQMTVECDEYSQIAFSGGIHPIDFSWNVLPGKVFETPPMSFGFTPDGFGGMTRLLQTHIRSHIEPEEMRGKTMPLLVNTYAAFGSGPEMNAENTLKEIRAAAEIGAELFVFDAGWQQSFGEWVPHREKFSGTLKPQVELAHKLGMKFGVWAELESFEKGSPMFEKHPEYLMRYPDQLPREDEIDGPGSHRWLVNLALPEVREFLYHALDSLIGENELDYFKLDMNRGFSHPGWPNPPPEGAQSLNVQYVRALYDIFGRIRKKYPNLIIENCACGNFRSDWGFNRFCNRMNRSDNQEALDVLKIHDSFCNLQLTKFAGGGCHISDDYFRRFNHRKTIPRVFQAFVGMMGSLSIGVNLLTASEEEKEELRQYAVLYKKLRNTVQNGEFYRINSHFDHPYAGYEMVLPDRSEAVLFAFAHGMQFFRTPPPFRLHALDPEACYDITIHGEDEATPWAGIAGESRTGRFLEQIGLKLPLCGDLDCRIVHLKKRKTTKE